MLCLVKTLALAHNNNNNSNNNNNNKVPYWTVVAGMEAEHPIPTKYIIRYAQKIAFDSKVQLLAFTEQKCLEQKEEWAKIKKLAP